MISPFIIESSQHGAALELSAYDPDYFIAEVRSRGMSARTKISSFMSDGLGKFFGEMAEQWQGWSGEKRWGSLEGELELGAQSDRLGHIFLKVCLREGAPAVWEVEVALQLEAGQLERFSSLAGAFETAAIRNAGP